MSLNAAAGVAGDWYYKLMHDMQTAENYAFINDHKKYYYTFLC